MKNHGSNFFCLASYINTDASVLIIGKHYRICVSFTFPSTATRMECNKACDLDESDRFSFTLISPDHYSDLCITVTKFWCLNQTVNLSSGSISLFSLWQHSACGLVKLRQENQPVTVRERSCFGLTYLFWIPQRFSHIPLLPVLKWKRLSAC